MAKKTGAVAVQAAALGHNKGNLDTFIKSAITIKDKMNKLKMEELQLYNKIDDQGFDKKEVKYIVKAKMKPVELSFKRGVNQLCDMLGMQSEFTLTAEQEKQVDGPEDEEEEEENEEDAA